MLAQFSLSVVVAIAIGGFGAVDVFAAVASQPDSPEISASGTMLAQAGRLRRSGQGREATEPATPAKAETFTAAKIRELRSAAAKTTEGPQDTPNGWAKSKLDPMKLVKVFAPLQVKKGVVLRAYQFKMGGNGNGVVWALPADAEFPEPDQCPTAQPAGRQVPKPPAAFDSIMEQMEGDGSAWSYMAASILGREIVEFGAMWHGTNWGTHRVLDDAPWKPAFAGDQEGGPTGMARTNAQEWQWLEPQPKDWTPKVVVAKDKVTVTFYTFSGHRKETIYRHTDTYKPGNYRYQSERKVVGEGKGGFMF